MSLSWKMAGRNFKTYLRLEKSLSENSVEAYSDDLSKLEAFFTEKGVEKEPSQVSILSLAAGTGAAVACPAAEVSAGALEANASDAQGSITAVSRMIARIFFI